MSASISSKPVFQLRKELDGSKQVHDTTIGYISDVSMDKSGRENISEENYTNSKILTENDTYIVKKLATNLPISSINGNDNTNGLVDVSSEKALITDSDNVFIWNYNSSQKSAPSIKIPLHEDNEPPLKESPTCLITWPLTVDESLTQSTLIDNTSIKNTSNCGVCIIEKNIGKITYYEDIESINNLYSQLSKAMSHSLTLILAKNECITEVLNIEPAGIVVATSLGAVHFITIRDTIGKPKIELKQTLIKAHKSLFYQFLRTGHTDSSATSSYSIVSLKQGPIVGKGERLLYITTKSGDFYVWQLTVSSKSLKRIEVNIFNKILESLQDLYPFAYGSLRLVDSHPLFYGNMNVHLFLSTITDNNEMYYIISTIIFDEQSNSFSIFSTYRLNTLVSPLASNQNLPKLVIPNSLNEEAKPITSVFVLFQNYLVITQISSKLDSSFTLKRKWEDVISFREDIRIIGSGYSGDSLYLISKEIGGIIQVELRNTNDSFDNNLEESRFVKSHVDQAIYFSNSSLNNPVEFDLPADLLIDGDTIERDIFLCNDEIFSSSSKFIPFSSTNLEQHLTSRINYFKKLLKYVEVNFNNGVSPGLKLRLVENFETMNCSLRFLQGLSQSDGINEKFNRLWSTILAKNNITLEDLIINQLDRFPQFFIQFIQSININSESVEFKSKLINLLTSCFYEAILEDGEKIIRYDMFNLDPLEINDKGLPWYINFDILDFLNKLFFNYKFSINENSQIDTSKKEQFLTLLKILYYFFNQIKIWVAQSGTVQLSDELQKTDTLYKENHIDWNHVLCNLNYKEQSIRITDFYQDLEALVETLETLNDHDELYEQFFEKFGYDFASTLFAYYISTNKLSKLFYKFGDQHDQLVRFFEENSEKYKSIAWIQDIFDGNYKTPSKMLGNIDLLGNPIGKNQLYLNIAKLSGLVDDTDIKIDDLGMIQSRLDLLDGEIDLKNRLDKDISHFNRRYSNTFMKYIFDIVGEKLQKNITIPFTQVIEQYSLLNDAEPFFCALKLLSFNGELIEYEVKKFLLATVWRRCILSDDYIMQNDDTIPITESLLYQVLENFFSQDLYYADIALPSKLIVTDLSILTDEYLENTYTEFVSDDNGTEIRKSIENDINEVLNNDELETRLHTIISAANQSTGNRCGINYETNTIEFN